MEYRPITASGFSAPNSFFASRSPKSFYARRSWQADIIETILFVQCVV